MPEGRRRRAGRDAPPGARAVAGGGTARCSCGCSRTAVSASTLAEQAGVGYNATLGVLRELEAAGKVCRSTERRSRRWRLVTDGDRVAERTAEFEWLAGIRER